MNLRSAPTRGEIHSALQSSFKTNFLVSVQSGLSERGPDRPQKSEFFGPIDRKAIHSDRQKRTKLFISAANRMVLLTH